MPTPEGTKKTSGPSPVESFAFSTFEYWSSGVSWNSTLMPVASVNFWASSLSMSLVQLADDATVSVTSPCGAAACSGCA